MSITAEQRALARRLAGQRDFETSYHGTTSAIRPITPRAQQWIDDNVESEPWQWLGPSLIVDSRYLGPLVEGIIADGLAI